MPQGSPRDDEPAIVASIPIEIGKALRTLKEWKLGDSFYYFNNKQHKRWAVIELWEWLEGGALVDNETECVFGGPHGILRVLLAVIRQYRNMTHSKTLPRPKGHKLYKWDKGSESMLGQVTDLMVQSLKASLDKLKASQPPAYFRSSDDLPWQPDSIHRVTHTSELVQEDWDGSSTEEVPSGLILPPDVLSEWPGQREYV